MNGKKAPIIDVPAILRKITPVLVLSDEDGALHPFISVETPKTFLKIASRHTLLQEALLRCERMAPPVIVCGQRWEKSVRQQAAALKIEPRLIVIEPASRSTAPAITLAALHLGRDEIMAFTPSDHIISGIDTPRFEQAIARAALYVRQHETLVLIGANVQNAASARGYIRFGAEQEQQIYENLQFLEKIGDKNEEKTHNLSFLSEYSGIFIAKIAYYGQNFTKLQPELLENIKNDYHSAPKVTIESAFLTKLNDASVVLLDAKIQNINTLLAFLRVWLTRLFVIIKE